jgi:predicted nucleic acid-binding protein
VGLIAPLAEASCIAVDTACFIYLIEQHPAYAPLLRPVFEAANAGTVQLVTSGITLLEVLVVPYRAGQPALAATYERLLTRDRGLSLVPIEPSLLRLAARLRAVHRVRTPDALQLAAALSAKASHFLTNDRRLPQLPGLRVVQLDELT